MKKIAILILPILLTSSLSASTFYIGANENYSHLMAKTNADTHVHDCQPGADDISTKNTFTHSARRHQLSGTLGYQYDYKNYVGGLEYYYNTPANLSSHYMHRDGFSYEHSLNGRSAHGGALKAGYFVTPNSLAFAKFIVERRNFKSCLTRKEADPTIQDYEKSTSFKQIGKGFSLGVEHHLDKKWALNLEYKMVYFPGKQLQHDTALSPTLQEQQRIRPKTSINTVMIGVIYRFV